MGLECLVLGNNHHVLFIITLWFPAFHSGAGFIELINSGIIYRRKTINYIFFCRQIRGVKTPMKQKKCHQEALTFFNRRFSQ